MQPIARAAARVAAAFFVYALLGALVGAPIAAERAVEGVRFEDRLGTLPVEVSLAHNGVSTLDTGILGRLYWDRTGTGGFGAAIRATGPPEAGGTLSSYVSPTFVRANAQFVNDPGEVARVYGHELQSELWTGFWWTELWIAIIVGTLSTLVFRARSPLPARLVGRRRRVTAGTALVVLAVAGSTLAASQLFRHWDGNTEVTGGHPMPGVDELSFSSPQTLEVAQQIQPFIEKNTTRIRERADQYEAAALESLRTQLPLHAASLAPRDGERIVIAEADPQGSRVGTRVRAMLYPQLREQLGDDVFAMRTISGDITSNGTVAEDGFVEDEASASPDIPTVAVKGDHDTETTLDQLDEYDVLNPDFETTDVNGLNVVAGNDPAFKALFGGLVINDSGVTETELGENLRTDRRPGRPADRALPPAPLRRRLHRGRRGERARRRDRPRDPALGRRHPRPATRHHQHRPPARRRTAPRHLEHRRRRGHLDRPQPARHLGWRRGEPHLQPVLHAVLGAPEDPQHPAAVRRHRHRTADRLRHDRHRNGRHRDHHRPRRPRAARRLGRHARRAKLVVDTFCTSDSLR